MLDTTNFLIHKLSLRIGDEDAEERSGAAPGDRNAVTAQ